MSNISYPKGNLFDSSSQTIVNTVNCVGVMGKGIALEYKLRYPEMYEEYKNFCDRGQIEIGKLHLWEAQTGKKILNFPTKIHYSQPSKLIYIEKGLKKFVQNYSDKGITSIAFPQLGSSLGGLDWETQVHPLMLKYLDGLKNLEVEIFSYDPDLKDNDFIKLETKTSRFKPEDFVKFIKLNKTQAETLYRALKKGQIKNSTSIHNLKGFSEKSLIKIKEFINSDSVNQTDTELRPQLFEIEDE